MMQKTTACFQLNKEVVCLLQYSLLMMIELGATYVLNIFPHNQLDPQRNIPLGIKLVIYCIIQICPSTDQLSIHISP